MPCWQNFLKFAQIVFSAGGCRSGKRSLNASRVLSDKLVLWKKVLTMNVRCSTVNWTMFTYIHSMSNIYSYLIDMHMRVVYSEAKFINKVPKRVKFQWFYSHFSQVKICNFDYHFLSDSNLLIFSQFGIKKTCHSIAKCLNFANMKKNYSYAEQLYCYTT